MNKLTDLRNYLMSKIPSLKRSPDRLLTFVDNGEIEFWPSIDLSNLTHRYKMPVTIIVTDWRHSADKIIIPIIEWMQVREPGMDPVNSIKFESEFVSATNIDLLIRLEITERVIVKRVEGGYSVNHVLPPKPIQMNEDAELKIIADGEEVV